MTMLWTETKRRVGDFAYNVCASALNMVFGRNERRTMMAFGPTKVPPKSTVTLREMPGYRFQPGILINTNDEKDLFLQGLYVGNKPQLPVFQSPISVQCFAATVKDNECRFDECGPSEFITLQVQNTSEEERTFSVSLIGVYKTGIPLRQ